MNTKTNDDKFIKATNAISYFLNKYIYLILASITVFTFAGFDIGSWDYNYIS